MLPCKKSDLTCKLNIQLEKAAQAMQMHLASTNLVVVAEKRVCGTLWCWNNAHVCFSTHLYLLCFNRRTDKTT